MREIGTLINTYDRQLQYLKIPINEILPKPTEHFTSIRVTRSTMHLIRLVY